jgi:hypothetical protein
LEDTTIVQVALKTEGVDEEPTEQSMLYDDVEVDDNVDDDNLNANHNDDVPLHFHSINDILGMARFVPHALVAEELHVVGSDEPTSFTKVERSPSWRKVMMSFVHQIAGG